MDSIWYGFINRRYRFPKADLIIWVRMPRWRYFWGLGKRLFLPVDARAPAGLTIVQKNYLTESFILHLEF